MTEKKEQPKPLTIGELARKRYDEIRLGHLVQHAIDAEQRMSSKDREKALEKFEDAGGDATDAHGFHLFCVVEAHDGIEGLLEQHVPFRDRGKVADTSELEASIAKLTEMYNAAQDTIAKRDARIVELEQALAPATDPPPEPKPEDAPKSKKK